MWKACVEHIQEENPVQRIVLVEPELLRQEHKGDHEQQRLDISINGFFVHVTDSTPMTFLAAVLEVIQDVE